MKWLRAMRSSWHHAFAVLWIMVIAVQWISFGSSIWYDETSSLVLGTLTVLAVIEILIPFRSIWKLLLKAAAVFYMLFRTLHTYAIYEFSGHSLKNLEELVSSLTPYIWFSLIAWILLEGVMLSVTTKGRILAFTGLNVAGFAVLDSFTPVLLWKEVAWTVFAGMAWLVTRHFYQFKQRYPQGWKHLRRSPLKIASNIAIIFALIIVAGVNMPEVPPTLTDPYTAFINVNGAGTTNVSLNGNVSGGQGSTESGYSRDDDSLGGGFNFDYSPVMKIQSTDRSYWRGETRMTYSGSGWVDRPGSRRSYEDVETEQTLTNNEGSSLPGKQVTQTVTMLNDQVYPVMFGAYAIRQVDSLDSQFPVSSMRWKPQQAELHWNSTSSDPGYPRSYTVVSRLPIIPEQQLRTRTYEQLYNGSLDQDYLQVPSNFPEQVSQLAKDITASANTPYEKVALLQQYLQQKYPYTNNPDLSRKKSQDFVYSFLFEIQEGYCDYYSTALVMMARSLDIPARWVKGYAPGQASFGDELNNNGDSDARTTYTVTNADAHSWAEIYFGEQYGWIPVEATPGFNMPLLTQQEDSSAPVDQPEDEPQEQTPTPDQPEQTPAVDEPSSPYTAIVVWAAVAVLILWGAYIVWRNRVTLHFALLQFRKGKPLSADEKVVVETERWMRYLRRKGLQRGTHETLRESVQRWGDSSPEVRGILAQLLSLFEKARYSPASVTDEEWRTVQAYAGQLRKSFKAARA
ncbi:transglutaminase domain-containing protein [Paenibacillus sp. JX-17]|uniref:Transglutaminase domain-containing protein n=1 Tax=Paenibacillus lacisoli TaxID=3064525 RepID=A0ABT9C8D9_9BACL|nr:transglutaminase domain-containing protein [Paenibacillus sp. JX-17]MDO7905512.1 transglutaminase domain-containing protein [Paenibacillus sp. JX-17]